MSNPSILVVSGIGLQGRVNGSKQRLLATVRGLARVGDVDLLEWGARPWRGRTSAVREEAPVPPLRSHVHLTRHFVPDRLRPVHRLTWTARAALQRDSCPPYVVACEALPSRRTIERHVPGLRRHDLIWCFELPSGAAIDRIPDHPPAILDVEAVHHVLDGESPRNGPDGARGRRAHEAFARHERRALRRCIDDMAGRFDAITFTNPVEAAAFALPNQHVLHNGCELPAFRGARVASDHPTFTFVGWMHYGPNAEAARVLVDDIVPELRARMGTNFEVRLVGSAPDGIRALASEPNVVVTGYVDDLAAELERADVIVAPIRTGAGTRLKIIEAFAAQVPVVSTTFGALGLDVVDRRHLVLADTPAAFAAACQELVADQSARDTLVTNAYDLVERVHAWPVVEAQVAALAVGAIAGAAGATAPRADDGA